jgi:hypothetical protein
MKGKNILFFFAFLVPALILALAVRGHYKTKRYFTEGDILMANWAAQRFEPINHGVRFVQLVDSIPIQNRAILDQEMTDSLRQAAFNFFMAYHDGDFDSYKKFRIPTGVGHYDSVHLKYRLNDIKAMGASPATTNLQDGDEIFQDYWQKVGAKTYSQFFQGLCVNGSELSVSCTNSSSWIDHFFDLSNFAKLGQRLLLNSLRSPTFISDPQPESITQQFGKIYTATLKCLLKNSDNNAYPVFCFWYYSPTDKEWIVYAIGSDYRGSQKQKTFLVF